MDYKPGNIDLHIHSTASDGSLYPLEILEKVQKIGLTAFALTDHDAVEGVQEIIRHGVPDAVKFLTGVEISAQSPDFFDIPGNFHILGYGFRPDDPRLNQSLKIQRDARKNRNPLILDRLKELGIDISLEEVIAESPDAQIGRPHIAKIMVKKGFVGSINEAFDVYLAQGKPAYVDKVRIKTETAIGLIQSSGGIPVLAHPGLLEVADNNAYDPLFKNLRSMGLKGIEVYFPSHSAEQTKFFEALAKKHGLLVTGGTDFHGAINPDIKLGVGRGDLSVPYTIYKSLANEINRFQSIKANDISGLDLSSIEANLNYTFTETDLLEKALRHSSFVNEHPDVCLEDNERLEFLGDAVLSTVISHLLMNRFPELPEGDLSKIRSNLVNESCLAKIAKKINLGGFIRLGKGEKQSNGHAKKSILADGLEALLAAVYLDGGFYKAFEVIDFHFSGLFDEGAVLEKDQDYKSRLQELVQAKIKSDMEYQVISESGPDHDKTFLVELTIGDIRSHGTGKNKKAAEQEAAQKALELLKEQSHP